MRNKKNVNMFLDNINIVVSMSNPSVFYAVHIDDLRVIEILRILKDFSNILNNKHLNILCNRFSANDTIRTYFEEYFEYMRNTGELIVYDYSLFRDIPAVTTLQDEFVHAKSYVKLANTIFIECDVNDSVSIEIPNIIWEKVGELFCHTQKDIKRLYRLYDKDELETAISLCTKIRNNTDYVYNSTYRADDSAFVLTRPRLRDDFRNAVEIKYSNGMKCELMVEKQYYNDNLHMFETFEVVESDDDSRIHLVLSAMTQQDADKNSLYKLMNNN